MRIESWVGAAVLCVMLAGGVTSAQQQQCPRTVLPANVELLANIGPVLQRVYDRSPTFRAQCERIANAANLHVRVYVSASIPARCRAYTVVRRREYQIRADVYLPPSSDHSELIAHEFEHLLEQIEGLDLRRMARRWGSGVREVERETFETDRAQFTGRVVRAEVREFRAPATN